MSDQPHDEPSGVIAPHPATDSPCALSDTSSSTRTVNSTPRRGFFAATLSPLAADGGVIGVKASARDLWVPPGSNELFGAVQRLGTPRRDRHLRAGAIGEPVIALTGVDGVVGVLRSCFGATPPTRPAGSLTEHR